MTAGLAHRGPDGSSHWIDDVAGVGFGHRRLSVLDLSSAGAQPMRSDCGRLIITFNGEIYNHLEIRTELEGAGAAPNWRGHSDTETVLYAIRFWGINAALRRFNGMFAFAVWDARDRTLTLCRDRFGEKPLFYGWVGSDLAFASELKAFAAHPDWRPSIDRSALTAFMRYSYVPAPWTIWRGLRKLNPGSQVTFTHVTAPGNLPQPEAYWSMRACMLGGAQDRLADTSEAIGELDRLLSQAVKRQLLSDVPVGAFLSGGIDSSTVVAVLQRQSTRPVRTFSIGFAETTFNEATFAGRIARHLGTEHTELTVSSADALGVVPGLARIYDEPFADSSQIPTHLVAALARQGVTVALSGDAGDELFGGYNRHVWAARLFAGFASLPSPARTALRVAIDSVAPEPANTIAGFFGKVIPDRYRTLRVGDLMTKVGRVIGASTPDEMYRLLCSVEDQPASIIIDGGEQSSWFADQMDETSGPIDPLDRMMLADSLSYLSDDVLQKVDRAAMAVSLETRVPFLDRDVVEFSCRVPPEMKVRDGQGKWLVRQLLDRYVPRELTDRPKTGFSIPLDQWLRGPLRAWASDLLAPASLERQGWFNAGRVGDVWADHLKGRRNHGSWLWNVLMAQSWAGVWCL
jgi:asparagine synthase (glutamine-hydrolysing)